MKPSVLFITKVCFLDAALEYIEEVKKYVTLNVLIEVDPHSYNRNILKLDKLPSKFTFFDPNKILQKEENFKFQPYIKGCASFQFFIHQEPRSFSFSSLNKSFKMYKYINIIKPEYIHFDDTSLRLVGLTFFMNFKKIKLIMNVHDPVPHSGEKCWKKNFARQMFYAKVYKFITFSQYSNKLFQENYPFKKDSIVFNLKPYNFFQNFISNGEQKRIFISFIGRVSEYKGIDIFIEAIRILNKSHPSCKFIIAGLPNNNDITNRLTKDAPAANIDFILRHIENKELTEIITKSQVVVCPYKDATQSGVIMTSLALNTPLIVTNVGGLPEYILDQVTGVICEPNANSLANAIEAFILDKNLAIQMSQNCKNLSSDIFNFTEKKILNLYS